MTLVQPQLGNISTVLHPKERKEMLSVSVLPDGRSHVRINSSSLAVLQECFVKSKLLLRDGWRAQDESAATIFGKAAHKALEVFYLGKISERILVPLEQLELIAYGSGPESGLIPRAISAFVKEAEPLAQIPDSDKRSIRNGIWILSEYFKTYVDDPFVAYVDDLGPFIERDFTLRIVTTTDLVVDIFGRIDFAFQNIKTGEIIPGDHKTTSFLQFHDSSYFDRDKPNHQYTMYMMGAVRVFGLKAEDFMVNVVEVKARPKTKAARGVSFPRQLTRRTQEDFEELIPTIEYFARQYLDALQTDFWPSGGVDACNKFGSCAYKQVCAAPNSMRQTILKNKFTKDGQREQT